MFRRSRTKRSRGQALVEFALAATLIFTLLSAAVDLGLIFFTLQTLRTAAQEGANYGSHPMMVMKADGINVDKVQPDYQEVIDRVRFTGGESPIGFVNLLDLNNDGRDDDSQGLVDDWADSDSYIQIELLKYDKDELDKAPTTCKTSDPRKDMRLAGQYCYVRVTVRYEYRFIFPFAPVFGDTIELSASSIIRVRSSFIG